MSGTTTTYPLDTVVRITDVIGGEDYQGSGVLISPDEVLTASHVLYSQGVGTASDIVVVPGYEDGSEPNGAATGVSFHYNPIDDANGYLTTAASQSDYAVIHLSHAFTGLGFMVPSDTFAGGTATLTGYPASANGTQVSQSGNVGLSTASSVLVSAAIGAGSSGGPVWTTAADGTAHVVGVISSNSLVDNTGYDAEITAQTLATIDGWVAQDDAGESFGATPLPVSSALAGVGAAEAALLNPVVTALGPPAFAVDQTGASFASGTVGSASTLSVATAPPSGATLVAPYTGLGLVAEGSGAVTLVDGGIGAKLLAADAGLDTVLGVGATDTIIGGGASLLVGDGTSDDFLSPGADTVLALGANASVTAAGSTLVFGEAPTLTVDVTAGAPTIVATAGLTVRADGGAALVFGSSAGLVFQGGVGSATLVAAGSATIHGGTGATEAFGSGATTYAGTNGADTILGGAGAITASGGGNGTYIFGGSAGGNRIDAGSGDETIIGGGAGDVIRTATAGTLTAEAGSGAETIDGSGGSGTQILFAGSGPDLVQAGSGYAEEIAGSGNASLVAGSGGTTFFFENGMTGGYDTIVGFDAARDYVDLTGYRNTTSSFGGFASRLPYTQSSSPVGAVVTLSDGTHILFQGVGTVPAAAIG